MRKTYSIDQLSSETVRQTRNEMAMMQRDLNKLRDGLVGLTRGVKAPVVRPRRGVIKGLRSSSNHILLAEIGSMTRYAVNSYLYNDGGQNNGGDFNDGGMNGVTAGLYRSQGQIAGRLLGDLISGQRIR